MRKLSLLLSVLLILSLLGLVAADHSHNILLTKRNKKKKKSKFNIELKDHKFYDKLGNI